MDLIKSALFGIIQGLTEFLPVSSSGHLVLAKKILNLETPGVLFESILHAGTLLAIFFYFLKDILKIKRKTIYLILTGTIPAAFVGYVFSSQIEKIFNSTFLVGVALLLTGVLNFLVDKITAQKNNINYKKSFIIGIFQAIAIIPGVSRSGSTIFAGTKLGISKKDAAKFSFLLSVPAVLGANILEISNYANNNLVNKWQYLTGFIFAFVSGLLAIKLVFRFLEKGRFKYFGFYCFLIGILSLVLS